MAVLALVSIALLVLDSTHLISIEHGFYYWLDTAILIVFWIDYIIHLYLAEDKKYFLKTHIIDLIAIFPYGKLAYLRAFRFLRAARFIRVIRAFAFMRVFSKRADRFLKTNGFIYMLYISSGLILTASLIMQQLEKLSFKDALYWSIVTMTTVGYGDISPRTEAGKLIAIILMIFGIGLLGSLTATIASFFEHRTVKGNLIDQSLLDVISNANEEQQKEIKLVAELILDDNFDVTIKQKNSKEDT